MTSLTFALLKSTDASRSFTFYLLIISTFTPRDLYYPLTVITEVDRLSVN